MKSEKTFQELVDIAKQLLEILEQKELKDYEVEEVSNLLWHHLTPRSNKITKTKFI